MHDAAAAPAPVSYHLTEEGAGPAPMLQALHEWGVRRAAQRGIAIEPDPSQLDAVRDQ